MASAKNTKHELSMLESLRYSAHGINAPFACSGTLVPKRPVRIRFRATYPRITVTFLPLGVVAVSVVVRSLISGNPLR